MRDIVFLNGEYLPREQAMVPVEDRGYQFADGVYEVTKFYGRHGLRLQTHLERMLESCEGLRIHGSPNPKEWTQYIDRLMDEAGIPDDETHITTLYQQITRGVAPRLHIFPKQPVPPSLVAYFRMAPVYTEEQRTGGVALSSQPDERWTKCNIKSICLLPVIMAKQAAVDSGAMEALLVRDGIVTEGGATNAFCIRNGVVYTHPACGKILSGVTRILAFEAAARAGVEIREEAVTLDQFASADEAFITSTTMNIMPVTRLDGKAIADGHVGPITKRLVAAIEAIIAREISSSTRRTTAAAGSA